MASNLRSLVADEVRAQMARKRISQRELGELLDIPQGSISRILSGRRSFRVEEILLIAQKLDVPVTKLLEPAAEELAASAA